jgi:hypothetical protein
VPQSVDLDAEGRQTVRALSAAVIVLAGSILIAAEVQTAHLHPDRWGLFFGLPLVGIGLLGWLVSLSQRGGRSEPKS